MGGGIASCQIDNGLIGHLRQAFPDIPYTVVASKTLELLVLLIQFNQAWKLSGAKALRSSLDFLDIEPDHLMVR